MSKSIVRKYDTDTNVNGAAKPSGGTKGSKHIHPNGIEQQSRDASAAHASEANGETEQNADAYWAEPISVIQFRPKAKAKKPSREFRYRDHFLSDVPPRVFVPAYICKLTGGDYAAIIASQLAYWNSAKSDCPRLVEGMGERPAWRPGYKGILMQTGITKHKAIRALDRLIAKDILEVVQIRNRPNELYFTASVEKQFRRAGMFEGQKKGVPGVLVMATEVLATDTGNQAIVLSNILPWFEPNSQGKPKLRIKRDGHLWRANSYKDLSDETGLSVHQAKRAITKLRENRLLHTAHYFFSGKRVLHVRPNVPVLNQRLRTAAEKLV